MDEATQEKPAKSDISPKRGRIENLKPITTRERAAELGRRSGEAKRARKASREEQARQDLVSLSYGTLHKAQIDPEVPWSSRIAAAIAALNREEGMPTQRQQVTHSNAEQRPLNELSDDELRKLAGIPADQDED